MFKRVLFQLHWFLGITAGTVLAIMGATGATLAFEDEIVRALNPALRQVTAEYEAGGHVLPLAELVTRVGAGETRAMQRIRVDATGKHPSLLRYEGGQTTWRYFDPYTGERFGDLRGPGFFDVVENLHRRLAAGDVGRNITGVCAFILVFFCLSGLYMRWPRRWRSLRAWFAVEWRRDGRSFLWSLHSVIGTWVMVVYLMIALTGLSWSYPWYRGMLTSLLDPGATQVGGEGRGQRAGGARGGNRGADRGERGAGRQTPATLDLGALQAGLASAVPGLDRGYVELRLPGNPGQPVSASVQVGGAAHDRAYDSVSLDAATGRVVKQQAYAAMPTGKKLLSSLLALHTGSFFGLPGRIVVMLSAGGMSLFFVTGWMLYLDRRRKKREVRASRIQLSPSTPVTGGDGRPWLVAFASQSGFAEQLAWRAAGQLQEAGLPVAVQPVARVDAAMLADSRQALFVLSTFGDGEAPDTARAFERRLLARTTTLPDLAYAVLALGDRQYQQFCGFARRVETGLQDVGAKALFPTVEVDRADPHSLATWQRHLAGITGGPVGSPLVEVPAMQDWPLRERVLLNPGSAAGPIWKVTLDPPPGAHWRAGDIIEIHPEALGSRNASVESRDAHAQPASREYSIASIAADGAVDLVVRLTRAADGSHGLGSGWLCVHAPIGAPVRAHVRNNTNFHRVDPTAPMILIGNGTGIAGLRSLLREADAEGIHGHWLVYGERTMAHDHVFADELDPWLARGHLTRMDLAFSRDQAERIYVQHLLLAARDDLERWMARGATIYVCGSLVGMASGVDAALRGILGDDAVDDLVANGRYRRDVY